MRQYETTDTPVRRFTSAVATTQEAQSVAIAPPRALAPVLSERFVLGWQHAAVCAFFAVLFLYVSYIPLYHSETWRHVAMGRWILDHQSLPTAATVLPLASGMTFVSTSWLSEVFFAVVERFGGSAALANVLAVCQLASLLLLANVFYGRSRQKRVTLLGVALVAAMWWGQLGILRPQVLATVCLCGLLAVLVRTVGNPNHDASEPPVVQPWMWIVVPAITALWANLDGSFVGGVLLLLSWAAGTAIDEAWTRRSVVEAMKNKRVRRAAYLSEAAILATLINPLGVDLWAHALRFENNPLWLASGGFRPLSLASGIGLSFGLFWATATVLFRHSRLPVRSSDVLILAVVSIAAAENELLIWWFAPLAVFVVTPHAADVLRRFSTSATRQTRARSADAPESKISGESSERPLRFTFTLACGLMVWLSFALSPVSTPVLGGTPRPIHKLHNPQTPLTVSQYLRESPPDRMVWAPQDWGDWLVWDGPADLKVFANSAAAILPRQVRYDYSQISGGESTWSGLLDQYDVGVLVIDKQRHSKLMRAALRHGQNWRIALEDDQALVLTRNPETVPWDTAPQQTELARSR